jgi:hypothetical protein
MFIFLNKLICFVVSLFVLMFIILTFSVTVKNEIEIGSSTNVLFVGDSHMKYGIDQSFVHSKNVGEEGESLYFSQFKLIHILQKNVQIDTVVLSVGYHNFSTYYHDYMYGKKSSKYASKYIDFMPSKELLSLFVLNGKYTVSILLTYIKHKFTILLNGFRYDNSTKFKILQNDDHFMLDRVHKQFLKRGIEHSGINESSLYAVNETCKKYNKKLIIINLPVNQKFKRNIPLKFIQKYNKVLKSLNVEHIDLTNIKLQNMDFLIDGDHLSLSGSKKVTKVLLEKIRK